MPSGKSSASIVQESATFSSFSSQVPGAGGGHLRHLAFLLPVGHPGLLSCGEALS